MASTECKITAFSFTVSGTVVAGTIDDTEHTVAITVPYGTAVTALEPTIAVSTGATVSPTSGTAEDFTSAVTYTVTAEDAETTQDYTVTVTVDDATVRSAVRFNKIGWFDVACITGEVGPYVAGGVGLDLGFTPQAVLGLEISGGYTGYYNLATGKLLVYSAAGTEITGISPATFSIVLMK